MTTSSSDHSTSDHALLPATYTDNVATLFFRLAPFSSCPSFSPRCPNRPADGHSRHDDVLGERVLERVRRGGREGKGGEGGGRARVVDDKGEKANPL
jgi:hypothetical protein